MPNTASPRRPSPRPLLPTSASDRAVATAAIPPIPATTRSVANYRRLLSTQDSLTRLHRAVHPMDIAARTAAASYCRRLAISERDRRRPSQLPECPRVAQDRIGTRRRTLEEAV